mmetsp:Transcript_11469/g.24729  ORF Transcript_11469/g.24729 Transcript_11469/m.24729 type:complete len:237 (+) Transcript_11469:258-968(+)
MAIVHRNLFLVFQRNGCKTEDDWRRVFYNRCLMDLATHERVMTLPELVSLLRNDLSCSVWELSNKHIKEFFDYLDEDRSGGLSVDELMEFMRSKSSSLGNDAKGASVGMHRRPTFRQKLSLRCQSDPVLPCFTSCSRDFVPSHRSARDSVALCPRHDHPKDGGPLKLPRTEGVSQVQDTRFGAASGFSVRKELFHAPKISGRRKRSDARLQQIARKLEKVGVLPAATDARRTWCAS